MFDELIRTGFTVIVLCSIIPLCASAVAGCCVGLFQSITQIQDGALPYLVKVGVVGGVLALSGGWIVEQSTDFLRQCIGLIVHVGGMP